MKCYGDFVEGEWENCEAEATHIDCCSSDAPVCERHACRYSITLAEAERRREARVIPSSWEAL